MKAKIALIILLVGCLGAFVLGWWPEHRDRVALEQQLQQAQAQQANSDTDARISRLHVKLLSLLDLVHANNYAAAQSAASGFFDAVRAEQTRTSAPPQLTQILAQRDAVTVALSRSDSSVEDTLRAMRALIGQLQPPTGTDSESVPAAQN